MPNRMSGLFSNEPQWQRKGFATPMAEAFSQMPPERGPGMASRIGSAFAGVGRAAIRGTQALGRATQSPGFGHTAGGLAQAIMGEHQGSWQARAGAFGQQLSAQQAFSSSMARALKGEELDPREVSILTPTQQVQVNKFQTENEKRRLDIIERRQNYELKLRAADLSDAERQDALNQFDKAIGFKEKALGQEKAESALDRESREKISETRVGGIVKSAEIRADAITADRQAKQNALALEVDTTFGGYTLEVRKQALAEAKAIAAAGDLDDAQFKREYQRLLDELSAAPSDTTGVSDPFEDLFNRSGSGAGF